jgi:hypothetical protein
LYPSDLVRSKNWGTEILTDTDLEAQLDLIIAWVMAALDSSSGHAHEATSNKSQKVNVATGLIVTSQAQGDALYASSASAFARLAAGTKGKCFTTGGAAANPSWEGMTTQGDVEYHDGINRARLAKGTAGQIFQMNAGATAPEWVSGGRMVQVVNTQSGALVTGNTILPYDDTIPQKTEGVELMTCAITPTSATNKLKIQVCVQLAHSDSGTLVAALFQDAAADALAASVVHQETDEREGIISFDYYMTAGTVIETTFKVRGGSSSAGTITLNGVSGARKLGGVMASSITITEIKV